MFIRFQGENLVDDKGQIFFIAYDVLREACLKASYEPLSTVKIISQAIQPIVGIRLNMGRCRSSELFNRLESEIRSDVRYQELKKKTVESERKRREANYKGKAEEGEGYFKAKERALVEYDCRHKRQYH